MGWWDVRGVQGARGTGPGLKFSNNPQPDTARAVTIPAISGKHKKTPKTVIFCVFLAKNVYKKQ